MKNLKLLILGAFNSGSIENFYVKGLQDLGIEVSKFDIISPYYASLNKSLINKVVNKINPQLFYKPINRNLLEFVSNKRFDIILIFKGMELFPETILELKNHSRILTNYNTDHPIKFWSAGSGNSNIKNSIQLYDLHFSYAKSIVAQLKTDFGKEAFCIPFGYDSNIKLDYSSILNNHSGKFLFIGAYDSERAKYLNRIHSTELEIYGDLLWHSRNWLRPSIQKAYKHRKLYGEEYAHALQSANGIINLLRKQNIEENSHNMRTFEVPGNGGLLITQRTEEQMEYFEEDKQAIFFDCVTELKDKLLFLSRRPDVISDIKVQAKHRSITSGYSYDDRSRKLLSILKGYLK